MSSSSDLYLDLALAAFGVLTMAAIIYALVTGRREGTDMRERSRRSRERLAK
jgi:hypothetical protein